jgi:histidinol-phosphatase
VSKPIPPLSRAEFLRTHAIVAAALQDVDRITLGSQRRVAIERKRDGSEVTGADRAAERRLRSALAAHWPQDTVLGEEYGGTLALSGRAWLVDPIDGTASYVLGLGTFGSLVTLLIDGAPVYGCIHLPAMDETTYAAVGHGCWLRAGRSRPTRVRVSAPRRYGAADVGLTSYKMTDLGNPAGPWRLSRLIPGVGRVRLVGDCVQYALLCRGELDGALDSRMSAWDIGALMVCVPEAGGYVADFHGGTRELLTASTFMAASSKALLKRMAAALSPGDGR